MKKTTIAFLFAFLFNITIAYAEPIDVLVNPHTFSDVDSTNVEILYLAEIGLVQGRPDRTVDSQGALNRAEALTLLARLFELDPVYDPECTFSDIESDVWYAGYVSTMCNAGMVNGYPDGTFRATNQLNRAEAVKLLVTGLGFNPEPPFNNLPPDVPSDTWYAPYVDYAVEHNIAPLYNGLFDGAHFYTRGDMFINLYRVSRIQELDADVYSPTLDPQVIESTEGKSEEVEFNVTGSQSEAEEYFNNSNVNFNEFIDLPLPLTYKEVAYYLNLQYREALRGRLHPNITVDVIPTVSQVNLFEDYDYTNAVTSFYEAFGVNIGSGDMSAGIPESTLDSVIASIKETVTNYDKHVESMQIFFNVVNSTTIEITFDERGSSTQNYDGYRYSLDTDYWPNLPEREAVIELTEDTTDQAVEIDWQAFEGPHYIFELNENNVPTTHAKESFTKLTVKLEEELNPDNNYTLKLNPLLFERYVKDGTNYFASNLVNDLEYLPASEFRFNGNSALEFTYTNSGGDSNIAGIVANPQVKWQCGWLLPLSAVLYNEDGRLVSTEEEFIWSVIEGNGELVVDEFGITGYQSMEDDTEVNLQVTYGGFTDTILFKCVDNMGV